MKIALLYIVPLDNWATFRPFAERWAKSYREFPPSIKHTLIFCWSGGRPKSEQLDVFADIPHKNFYYGEDGFDIGAAQHVACNTDFDFFVAQTSRAYYYRPNWLERIVQAREKHGEGLYGASCSNEHCPLLRLAAPNINLHMRTVFYAMSTAMWRKYPYVIDNREKGFCFESGEWNYLTFYRNLGYPAFMVTFDEILPVEKWGLAPRGFRQGDQGTMLVHDKHSDLFAAASPIEKKTLRVSAGLLG